MSGDIAPKDPRILERIPWLSGKLNVMGWKAAAPYTRYFLPETSTIPFVHNGQRIEFSFNHANGAAFVSFVNGKSFGLDDYFQYKDIDKDLTSESERADASEAFSILVGHFDEELWKAIASKELPRIPPYYDLKGVVSIKLEPFMNSLGFICSYKHGDQTCVFVKRELEISITAVGRLDPGYFSMKIGRNAFKPYQEYVKALGLDHELLQHWIGREAGLGNYYKLSAFIRRTLPDILKRFAD